jgi:hypothetical protein
MDGEQFPQPLAPNFLLRALRRSIRPTLKMRQRDGVLHGGLRQADSFAFDSPAIIGVLPQ